MLFGLITVNKISLPGILAETDAQSTFCLGGPKEEKAQRGCNYLHLTHVRGCTGPLVHCEAEQVVAGTPHPLRRGCYPGRLREAWLSLFPGEKLEHTEQQQIVHG